MNTPDPVAGLAAEAVLQLARRHDPHLQVTDELRAATEALVLAVAAALAAGGAR